MTWNFDMSQAPKGGEVVTKQMLGKNEVELSRYVSPLILAAGPTGGFVGVTRWDNKRGAWVYFSKDAPPIAWQPMPDHPSEVMK